MDRAPQENPDCPGDAAGKHDPPDERFERHGGLPVRRLAFALLLRCGACGGLCPGGAGGGSLLSGSRQLRLEAHLLGHLGVTLLLASDCCGSLVFVSLLCILRKQRRGGKRARRDRLRTQRSVSRCDE